MNGAAFSWGIWGEVNLITNTIGHLSFTIPLMGFGGKSKRHEKEVTINMSEHFSISAPQYKPPPNTQ